MDYASRLARRITRLKPSPTLSIDTRAKVLRASGIDVIPFGVGEPDFDTPEHVKAAAVEAIREGFTKYTPVPGIPELRAAIAEKLRRDNGLHYDPSEIVVSCGGKHTLYNLAMALFQKGDEVVIPAPYWVTYPEQVAMAEATPVIVETRESDGFLLTPQALERVLTPRTKAIILNSPANPTGAAYPRETLEAIARLAVQRAILVISDEIYEHILYDGHRHVSVASLGEDVRALTITVNGLSKTYAMTGWRVGYAAGPRPIMEAVANLQSQSTSNPTSVAQKAAVAALRGPQDAVRDMVREFDRRRRVIVEHLNRMDGVRCALPAGTFYVFPNVQGVLGRRHRGTPLRTSAALAEFLLEEARIAVVPGEAFGAEGYLRISYAADIARIEEGMTRMAQALERLD